MAKKPDLENIEASLGRWKTRLKRAMNAIDKLEKQKKRLAKKQDIPASTLVAAVRTVVKPPPVVITTGLVVDPNSASGFKVENAPPVGEIDTSIPAFLQRKKPDAAGEAIAKEIAERAKAKTAGRIAKLKAKKSGETKKMPLSGKAALEAIRNG